MKIKGQYITFFMLKNAYYLRLTKKQFTSQPRPIEIYSSQPLISYLLFEMRRIQNHSSSKRLPATQKINHPNLTCSHPKTIAEINQVSARQHKSRLSPNHPFRILLPQYFNIPKFIDQPILGSSPSLSHQQLIARMRAQTEVRQKLKDLEVLAMGMRRAKSIKEESRYYFTQGVLLHNSRLYEKSIAAFEKFLKIVLFIKDEMSVELALNAIGVEYMHLNDYNKAMEYHRKQGEMSGRSDQFACHVNVGLCQELKKDYESALNEYRQAHNSIQLEAPGPRGTLIQQLITRVQSASHNPFLTSQPQQQNSFLTSPNNKQIAQSRSADKLDKSSTRVEMAILSAEEKIEDYIQSMRNSFVAEKGQ